MADPNLYISNKWISLKPESTLLAHMHIAESNCMRKRRIPRYLIPTTFLLCNDLEGIKSIINGLEMLLCLCYTRYLF